MMMRIPMTIALGLVLACKAKEAAPSEPSPLPRKVRGQFEEDEGRLAGKDRSGVAERAAPGAAMSMVASAVTAAPAPPPAAPKGGAATIPEGPTRAWFPETFLFEPLVVTDDHGAAVVPVRVPDRLTTWRVLALAHSRTGAQGGTVASFLGTLPTYVDPVVPPFLVQGDQVRLPIQLVNTTAAEVAGALEVSVQGARLVGAAGGPRRVPAQGSVLDAATIAADRAGTARLRVALAGSDAIERAIEIRPAGRPVSQTRSGTLAAPRTFTTTGPSGPSGPSGPTGAFTPEPADRVRLLVFPGALALLRSELAVSIARSEVADDAYALLLAGRAAALLAALGDKPDPAVLRELAIVTAQRAIRDGRTLDVDRAALLVEPALAHPGNPVLARLGERAAASLAQSQRPDGTFAGGTGWTLQRVLVATAEATRAVAAAQATTAQRQRSLQVATRAAGAFARTADQVSDGYTAAAILAAGAATGELADALRRRVLGAIQASDDGAKYLAVADGVVRGDGVPPSRIEATALAVLALAGVADAPLADLGTTLLGAYTPALGWGDGRTNLVAMQGVLALFKAPLPGAVTVTLTMDGAPVVHGTLEGAKLRDVLTLAAGGIRLAGPHTWNLTAEPAVPGLGYSLTLESWLAWDTEPPHDGLELALPARVDAVVGKPVEIALAAAAPSGLAIHIQHALPAGVQVDAASLQALVAAGALASYVAADGALDLNVPPVKPGASIALSYRVIPTLGGTLHSGGSLIEAGGARLRVPPALWVVK